MSELTAWEHLQIVRNKERPTVLDYIPLILMIFMNAVATVYTAMTGRLLVV